MQSASLRFMCCRHLAVAECVTKTVIMPLCRPAAGAPLGWGSFSCLQAASNWQCGLQVSGCGKDLTKEKEYYQRYRICEEHLKLGTLLVEGCLQRFCQQCGRFQPLGDFDGNKR